MASKADCCCNARVLTSGVVDALLSLRALSLVVVTQAAAWSVSRTDRPFLKLVNRWRRSVLEGVCILQSCSAFKLVCCASKTMVVTAVNDLLMVDLQSQSRWMSLDQHPQC